MSYHLMSDSVITEALSYDRPFQHIPVSYSEWTNDEYLSQKGFLNVFF
jgi:hypothetical protein